MCDFPLTCHAAGKGAEFGGDLSWGRATLSVNTGVVAATWERLRLPC